MSKKLLLVLLGEGAVIVAVVLGIIVFLNRGSLLRASTPTPSLLSTRRELIDNIIQKNKVILSGTGTFFLSGKVAFIEKKIGYTEITFSDPTFTPVRLNSSSKISILKTPPQHNVALSQVKVGDLIYIKAVYDFKQNAWDTQSPTEVDVTVAKNQK